MLICITAHDFDGQDGTQGGQGWGHDGIWAVVLMGQSTGACSVCSSHEVKQGAGICSVIQSNVSHTGGGLKYRENRNA